MSIDQNARGLRITPKETLPRWSAFETRDPERSPGTRCSLSTELAAGVDQVDLLAPTERPITRVLVPDQRERSEELAADRQSRLEEMGDYGESFTKSEQDNGQEPPSQEFPSMIPTR